MIILARTAVALVLAFSAEPVTAKQAPERYSTAVADPSGALQISTRDGRTISIPKEREQTAFAQIRISPTGDAVGWVAMQGNCCTSYDIPRELNLYRNGRRIAFEGNGLPVWDWAFLANGSQIAFHQETVHGGMGVHYELRDLESGEIISTYDPEEHVDGSANRVPSEPLPGWVRELRARQQQRL